VRGHADSARRPDEPEGVARGAAPSAHPPWIHGGETAALEPTVDRRRRVRQHRFGVPTVEEITPRTAPDPGDAVW
jgi:hypothetical protein